MSERKLNALVQADVAHRLGGGDREIIYSVPDLRLTNELYERLSKAFQYLNKVSRALDKQLSLIDGLRQYERQVERARRRSKRNDPRRRVHGKHKR